MPRAILLSFLGLLLFAPAQALDRLTPGGVALGGAPNGTVARSVDLNGDQPVATFILARIGGRAAWQRTPAGAWTSWDGDPASLIDARLELGVGTVTYRVDSTPMGADALILGYRTPDTLKFGILGLGGR